jgi:hypothetical protein
MIFMLRLRASRHHPGIPHPSVFSGSRNLRTTIRLLEQISVFFLPPRVLTPRPRAGTGKHGTEMRRLSFTLNPRFLVHGLEVGSSAMPIRGIGIPTGPRSSMWTHKFLTESMPPRPFSSIHHPGTRRQVELARKDRSRRPGPAASIGCWYNSTPDSPPGPLRHRPHCPLAGVIPTISGIGIGLVEWGASCCSLERGVSCEPDESQMQLPVADIGTHAVSYLHTW